MRIAVLMLVFSSLLAWSAAAAERRPKPDRVVLTLSAEDWVETNDALVRVSLAAAFSGDRTATLRADMLKVLGELAADVDWRITRFVQGAGKAGLENWRVQAEARINESALGGLRDRARGLSRPGLQMVIAGTDFSPTLAEREKVAGTLRERIYRMVNVEAARLARAFAGRTFRLHLIDFTERLMRQDAKHLRRMRAEAAPAQLAASATGALSVSRKLVVTATAVLRMVP